MKTTVTAIYCDASGTLRDGSNFPVEPKSYIPETESEANLAQYEAMHELPDNRIWKNYYDDLKKAKAEALPLKDQEEAKLIICWIDYHDLSGGNGVHTFIEMCKTDEEILNIWGKKKIHPDTIYHLLTPVQLVI